MAIKGYYRCRHSGLLFPEDYCRNWGTKYGIGLGPKPVSEVLDTMYSMPLAESRNPANTMHPVGTCYTEVDYVELDEANAVERMAILAIDDPDYQNRMAVIREKQRSNPKSKLYDKKEIGNGGLSS